MIMSTIPKDAAEARNARMAEAVFFLDNLTHYRSRGRGTDRPTWFGSDVGKVESLLQERDALQEATRKMLAALKEAELKIEHLHELFTETGTGNAILARINAAIAAAQAAGIEEE